MKYFKLKIDQQCAAAPGKKPYSVWEKENSLFGSIEQVRTRLNEIYGKIPFRKNSRKIYRDKKNNNPVHIGYCYSFWEHAQDRSRPGRKYWATDWITITHITETAAVKKVA